MPVNRNLTVQNPYLNVNTKWESGEIPLQLFMMQRYDTSPNLSILLCGRLIPSCHIKKIIGR